MARATWNGVVLAETSRPVLLEGNVYFPPEDVRQEYLVKTRAWSVCPWKGMFAAPEGFDFDEAGYRLEGARCEPPPVSPPVSPEGPPVWLGVRGNRGLQVAARLADGWNYFGAPAEFSEARDRLARYCEQAQRDICALTVSVQLMLSGDRWDRQLEDARAYAARVQHLILGIPASLGPAGIETLASKVVRPLRDQPGRA